MKEKVLQIKLNKLLCKVPQENSSKIIIMLSSKVKLARLKTFRPVRNNCANLFGESFTFPIEHLPITLIVNLQDKDGSEL